MGDYTFTQFKDMLKFELGERTDLSSHSTLSNLYGCWINIAYRQLTTTDQIFGKKVKLFFPDLHTDDPSQSTTDGVAYVAVPDTALYVEGIWDRTSDVELDNISWAKYKSYTGRASATDEAAPTEWTRRGSRLYLYRTPNATYNLTIYYRRRVVNLDGADYNQTLIGSEWDEPILKLAVIYGLIKLKRYDEAKQEKAEWLETILGLSGIYFNDEFDRRHQLKPDITWRYSR